MTVSQPRRGAGHHVEIFVVSFAALLLEISYTRVISYKLFYYYTYLVIGLALLGIGTGAVIVATSTRVRRASTDAVVLFGLLGGAASVAVGYLVVARIPISTLLIWDYGTRSSLANAAALVAVCLALFASFIAVGLMIATILGRGGAGIGGLYFADLVGGGLACAGAVLLLDHLGAPATVYLAGVSLAFCGAWVAWRIRRSMVPIGLALGVAMGVAVLNPHLLPDQRLDSFKTTPSESRHSEWNAVFRVDARLYYDRLLLFHDGIIGSAIYEWDGNVENLGRFDTDPRSLPFALASTPPGRVLIIGAAGGHEVLTSLYFRAGHVDAVELNPVTHSLVADKFADYSGHLADREGVSWVQGDGRSFLTRSDDAYDLVWYPAPDSYAATNAATAGAFVLSESYLYTREAITESLDHLTTDGVLAAQFGEVDFGAKPNRTSRYVTTVRAALAQGGVTDPSRHVVVITSPYRGPSYKNATILVKNTPFEDAELARLADGVGAVPGSIIEYAPGAPGGADPIRQILTRSSDDLERWYDQYPYDVRPITDDSPFFWHFTPFGDVIADLDQPIDKIDVEDATGERVLLLLLAVAFVFAAVFLLLPFVAVRDVWKTLPAKGRSAFYFMALGLGFMLFEITLIQRLTLFLGYPTYSLTVTLASLLVFTGVGALLSPRTTRRPERAVPALGGAMVGLAAFYLFGLPWLTDALLHVPLTARVITTFVVLAPLGVCLGTFMPLGLTTVASLTDHSEEYVAWGWAVNGFASVIGAVLTTLLAMTFGFRTVLVVGLGAYLVALVTLRALLRAVPSPSPAD